MQLCYFHYFWYFFPKRSYTLRVFGIWWSDNEATVGNLTIKFNSLGLLVNDLSFENCKIVSIIWWERQILFRWCIMPVCLKQWKLINTNKTEKNITFNVVSFNTHLYYVKYIRGFLFCFVLICFVLLCFLFFVFVFVFVFVFCFLSLFT